MDNILILVLALLIGILGPGAAIALLILLNPEKVEKWGSIVAYTLSRLGSIFRFAHKRAVQLDLQGHINEYVKVLARTVPMLEAQKVKIEFVGPNATRESVLRDGMVILRLRRDDPQDINFVHGAYFFVSSSLLFRVKRYISPSQRDALDLYVTTRLIESEKPSVVDCFLEDYLHPALKDPSSDRAQYFEKLSIIDRGGLFYPVFLEELHVLGGKVFGARQDEQIVKEVRGLMDFLRGVAERKVGTEIDLHFKKKYCRSAIMIVGRKSKLADSTNYTAYIKKSLFTDSIEVVYLLGSVENRKVMDEVCQGVSDLYAVARKHTNKMTLNYDDGPHEIDAYIIVLQLLGSSVYLVASP